MMLENLAVAQVVAPLVAAPACLVPRRRVALAAGDGLLRLLLRLCAGAARRRH
ncbi:MAG: hypothetical protein M5U09_16165 [Gammaproteobacteria bacterium]|nr:hypothetical protein [Gammaproteobacteria bacterium]